MRSSADGGGIAGGGDTPRNQPTPPARVRQSRRDSRGWARTAAVRTGPPGRVEGPGRAGPRASGGGRGRGLLLPELAQHAAFDGAVLVADQRDRVLARVLGIP